MDDFFQDVDTTTDNAAANDATNDATNDGSGDAIALGAPADATNTTEDYFAGISNDADAANNDGNDANDDNNDGADQKQGNDEPTVLSVWQEQRRIELQKRRDTEAEEQRALVTQGVEDLKEFKANRQRTIEATMKDNRDKESGLRDDLNSVFQHGTLWEQVGRLVNLQEVKNTDGQSTDRMRNLLIHLKNIKQQ